jgi:hypothetical protein
MFSPPFLARRDINEYNVLSKYIGSFGPRILRIFSPLLVFSGNSHGYKVLFKNILGIFSCHFWEGFPSFFLRGTFIMDMRCAFQTHYKISSTALVSYKFLMFRTES